MLVVCSRGHLLARDCLHGCVRSQPVSAIGVLTVLGLTRGGIFGRCVMRTPMGPLPCRRPHRRGLKLTPRLPLVTGGIVTRQTGGLFSTTGIGCTSNGTTPSVTLTGVIQEALR